MNFLRKFAFELIEAVSSTALIIVSLWLSIWLKQEFTKQNPPISKNTTLSADLNKLIDLFSTHLFDFKAPVFYFLALSFFALIGRFNGFRNKHNLDTLTTKEASCSKSLRVEIEAHGTSKKYYYYALQTVLELILTPPTTGFDHTCRVTIYRLQGEDDRFLKQIFRYSQHSAYNSRGRFRVPVSEGIVGAAWKNHGVKEFNCSSDPSTNSFKTALSRLLKQENCSPPHVALSMPSRHYFAKAFDDLESGEKIGIVVFESTDTNKLNRAGIEQTIDTNIMKISRSIKHLSALDQEFNPDPEKGVNDG